PLMSFWNGSNGAQNMFKAIRDCNIFLENINRVADMDQFEKDQWSAEVRFLKAYYHWWLLRMYGPIPIVDTNLPIDASQEAVQVERIPVDSCFNYISKTIDGALPNLPDIIQDPANQMGRITKAIALAAKAEILTTAASPLFNGNTSYVNFRNKAGQPFFNQTTSQDKWVTAMNACKDAITAATANGNKLNKFNPAVSLGLPPEIQTVMDIRSTLTDNFNSEVIWGNTNSLAGSIQTLAQPRINALNAANFSFLSLASVPFNIVNMFYTKNGVPIDEDKTLNFASRGSSTRTAVASEKYYIQPNYNSAAINFDREPRFYADLGFDGSILFGNGNVTVSALNHLEAKQGQYSGWAGGPSNYNITGYWPVKLVNYLSTLPTITTYSYVAYAWPVYRLSNLYLLYSETINEVSGPTAEAFNYSDQVRARAGLPTVATSWTNFSNNPSAYTTKDGLRKIIHRERMIELAFEGQRFWDQRRWKEAEKTFQEAIQGWNIGQADLQAYYQPVTLFNRSFQLRDYFWPIAENDLLTNKNLVQNPGW
ncbi:MAG: starch-binding protein, partial [Chitinophagaceae bacterium]|nr:starch-binding protein [Chitinophagaceae bacterium]